MRDELGGRSAGRAARRGHRLGGGARDDAGRRLQTPPASALAAAVLPVSTAR
ncbi:MAG: hypothetical protein WDM92_11890 [Caulobacteraceae bacterium]